MACQVETKSNEVLKQSNTVADKENLEATEEPVAKKPKRQPRLAWVNFTILFLAILSYYMYNMYIIHILMDRKIQCACGPV